MEQRYPGVPADPTSLHFAPIFLAIKLVLDPKLEVREPPLLESGHIASVRMGIATTARLYYRLGKDEICFIHIVIDLNVGFKSL